MDIKGIDIGIDMDKYKDKDIGIDKETKLQILETGKEVKKLIKNLVNIKDKEQQIIEAAFIITTLDDLKEIDNITNKLIEIDRQDKMRQEYGKRFKPKLYGY